MATFGKTSIVGTTNGLFYGGYIYSCPFTLAEDGTVTDIYLYGYSEASSPGDELYLGIYNNASPFALQCVSAGPIIIGVGVGNVGWVHGAVNKALTAGTYHLGVCGHGSGNFHCYYTAGATRSYEACADDSSWPATVAAWDGGEANREFCIYATYAAGGGAIGPSGAIVSAEDVDGAAMMRGTIQSEV